MNELLVFLRTKENKTKIVWSAPERYFILTVNASADTAMQIALSVTRIK